ncbi:MAG TPA: cytochrome C oxidase subunit IV family protein [Bryobacteraceae bacterium]|nr:cytochrome C oxidase subunit IV family protein [Bryobacteraceae bacterium]
MSIGIEETHAPHGASLYYWVWIYLLAITALEVFLAYEHLFSTQVMLAVLMLLSVVKAGLIMAYFMHLRFEKAVFVLCLVPAVVVVISLLAAFFPDSYRLLELRVR